MKTLEQLLAPDLIIPTATVWSLNELAEYRGKQELFTKQAPHKLKRLLEHALIESAVCSNRIEGVEIDAKRVGTVVFGQGLLLDRNEEEIRGYQSALSWIHEDHNIISLDADSIRKMHSLSCPTIWDSGLFKEKDGEIIEKHVDGRVSIRFKPTSAKKTPDAIEGLSQSLERLIKEKTIPPLVVWAAHNLDFLCIHPFRDGNGRVSRLLLLLTLYHLGFAAGRYVSIERLIEQNKERYDETLKISSQGWHEGKHDPWPYINYLLYILKLLYADFEYSIDHTPVVRGEKTEAVRRAILGFKAPFHVRELQQRCPEVSLDMIRKIMKDMSRDNEIQCVGRGRNAHWQVIGN
ncbi:MAG: Fic family protein [Spartobacteria bacterium]|nr:Fic family protein [Spartobacteria bacterium]